MVKGYGPCTKIGSFGYCFHILITFFIGVIFVGCSGSPKPALPDKVALVIGSMSDSLPRVALPEDADPTSEDWLGVDLDPKTPVLPLYPAEQAKTFLLPPGYAITPVLTEPQIEQPGAIAFDGNGRMYVLELRTYMLTADSEGTLQPVSRISRWEDSDNDGVYETGSVFVDSLIFPRFVLPYGKDAVLTMNSDEDNVFKFTDTNGDGKADKKELFTNNYGRSGNVEHQQAFMYWGMDNWLYSTVNAFRVRETPNGVLRETTGYNRAQWGITHDDDGKLWFQGGASGLPSYFQLPIHYGNFTFENEFAEGFEIPYGAAVKIGDMQGGMDEIRQPDGSLNRVTGAAGNDIFRGDRLPKALYGQLFYGEPVARIVRQVNPVVQEGLTTLHNVYQAQNSEFLRSTDPLFRPVDMTTAPDGTLYITDMYHGIIQEGQWAQKGSYLRTKIEQYQLDKVVGLGRIWRITHESKERDNVKPRMLEQTPAQLIAYLGHANGWWRDKAQQLIVLSKDKSVVPQLKTMALKDNNVLARFHALWSLEGLNALDMDLLQKLLEDNNPRMRVQALRASESMAKGSKGKLAPIYTGLMRDVDVDVAIQAMLTAKQTQLPNLAEEVKLAMAANKAKGIQVIGEQLLNPVETNDFFNRGGPVLTEAQKQSVQRGANVFNELCVQCHGIDGAGTPLGNGTIMAPPLTGSPRVQAHADYVINTLLYGLEGPLDGKSYPGGIMVGMQEQSDQWIADVASYIRMNLTNKANMVEPKDVLAVRSKNHDRKSPFRFEELIYAVPQVLAPKEGWKITASHTAPSRIGGTAAPLSAFNFEGWTTGEAQRAGMWFQVEFPTLQTVGEISFHAPPKQRGSWRDKIPPYQTFPRNMEIKVSQDGKSWKTVHSTKGENEHILVVFEPVKTKFLRIEQTGNLEENAEIPWSMRQLKIYGKGQPVPASIN